MRAEVGKLNTKLKHVDIHNHWLRQEYQKGHITVEYVQSKSMIADGLTKALSLDSHRRFLEQMKLIRIRERLLERQNHEAAAVEALEMMDIE